MATIYLLGYPGWGHLIPLLPIMEELTRRGERVVCFETSVFQKAVRATGAEFRDYGDEFPPASARVMERFHKSTSDAIRVQLETSRWALEHLLEPLRREQPAFLVHDSLSAWGWYLAHALEIPTVSLFSNFAFNFKQHQPKPRGLTARARAFAGRLRRANSRTLADDLSRRYRVPRLENLAQLMRNRGTLNLVFTSREFQPDGSTFSANEYRFVGPSMVPRPDAPAFPFEKLDGRPLIYISLGTVANAHPAFYAACVRAFRNAPYQIVLATGDNIKVEAPSNFIVRPFVPQLEILKRAAAFVTHGGMNSVNEALYFDVPLVLCPQGGNTGWVAARAAELGAGIVIQNRELATDTQKGGMRLRDAVNAVLSEPRYKLAAKRIGDSLRATGGAATAADEIVKFRSSD